MTAPRPRPASIDQLIAMVQREFPAAGIRITGRARTIRRQAELMADRIRADRQEFLRTYRAAQHITEMDQWYQQHRTATVEVTVDEFERIIQRARARGAVVSNHLSDTARDISWPLGTAQQLDAIEARIRALGATVLREPNAAGGRHWHVDW
jgi:methylphosphotriester-DNA--protein-cysteine methyltransferase